MVRLRGLEPPRRFQRYHLKVVRLPIPPQPQSKTANSAPASNGLSRVRGRANAEVAPGNRAVQGTQAADCRSAFSLVSAPHNYSWRNVFKGRWLRAILMVCCIEQARIASHEPP
jgi:hypothetical protein